MNSSWVNLGVIFWIFEKNHFLTLFGGLKVGPTGPFLTIFDVKTTKSQKTSSNVLNFVYYNRVWWVWVELGLGRVRIIQ